jgi:dihydrofolate reductase
MRRLILKMSVSLDGFVSGPNGEDEWIYRTGGSDTLEWLVEDLGRAGLHALGSKSYPAMAAFYPTSTASFAPPMNDTPKVVFTQRGLQLPVANEASDPQGSWSNPFVADGDLRRNIERLKAQPGKDIMAHGGATFAQSLVANDLVDEYRLMVRPVALGAGLALFPQTYKPIDLQLVHCKVFDKGAIALTYHRVRLAVAA